MLSQVLCVKSVLVLFHLPFGFSCLFDGLVMLKYLNIVAAVAAVVAVTKFTHTLLCIARLPNHFIYIDRLLSEYWLIPAFTHFIIVHINTQLSRTDAVLKN